MCPDFLSSYFKNDQTNMINWKYIDLEKYDVFFIYNICSQTAHCQT